MNKTRRALLAAMAVAAVAVLAGCGQSGPPEKGLLVTGTNVRATQPPWAPQYAGLHQRIKTLGLPTGDSEKFHIHAQVSIYNQGLLVPIPANVGIDERHHIETTIHTHDGSGIIHMEARHLARLDRSSERRCQGDHELRLAPTKKRGMKRGHL